MTRPKNTAPAIATHSKRLTPLSSVSMVSSCPLSQYLGRCESIASRGSPPPRRLHCAHLRYRYPHPRRFLCVVSTPQPRRSFQTFYPLPRRPFLQSVDPLAIRAASGRSDTTHYESPLHTPPRWRRHRQTYPCSSIQQSPDGV